MQEDIGGLAERLVIAIEETYGKSPLAVKIQPNGDVDVNVRIGFRGETHPEVVHRRRKHHKRKA